jgi:hypothetical protein
MKTRMRIKMKTRINRILICLLLIASIAPLPSGFTKEESKDPYNLVQEYGPELKGAPFPLRYQYEKKTGKKWTDTSAMDRYTFLTNYHRQLEIEKNLKAANEKRAAMEEKMRQDKEKSDAKALKDKMKSRTLKEKNAQKQKEMEDREFQKSITTREKALRDLRRKQEDLLTK